MNQQRWKIAYAKDGVHGHEEVDWPELPDREHAARLLRDRIFPTQFLIPDTPRSEPEPTAYQLQKLGIEILAVEPLEDENGAERQGSPEKSLLWEAEAARLRLEIPGATVTIEDDGVWCEQSGRRRRVVV